MRTECWGSEIFISLFDSLSESGFIQLNVKMLSTFFILHTLSFFVARNIPHFRLGGSKTLKLFKKGTADIFMTDKSHEQVKRIIKLQEKIVVKRRRSCLMDVLGQDETCVNYVLKSDAWFTLLAEALQNGAERRPLSFGALVNVCCSSHQTQSSFWFYWVVFLVDGLMHVSVHVFPERCRIWKKRICKSSLSDLNLKAVLFLEF